MKIKALFLSLIFLATGGSLFAAPTITVSGNSVSILGSAQTISLTCTLIDPNNTGNLRSGSNIITVFVTNTVTPGNVATCGPIYGNDVITDGYGNANTTYYKVQVFTVSGGIVASTPSLQQFYAFTGSGTVDLATATPLAPSFFAGPSGNVSMPGTLTVTGATTLNSSLTVSGTGTFTGDLYAKSGRPWYDVMAFGAKNDNSTDDTAAINAAMTAACATSPPGGTIFFPRGTGYKTANTTTIPFTIACNNLTFLGTGYTQVDVPTGSSVIYSRSLNNCVFQVPAGFQGTEFIGLSFEGDFTDGSASAICSNGTSGGYIERNFFDQFGSSCISITAGLSTWWIEDNLAENCLQVRPATTDTGAFDIASTDAQVHRNFVTPSVPTAAGNIGTGHTYAYAFRGANGFATNNMGEISQHGYLVTANYFTLMGNRSFLQQGNGFHITGQFDVIVGNKSISSSQNANNSFDGFLCDGNCSENVFSDNYIGDTGTNGNHTRHGISDANSNGATNAIGNKYSNNQLDLNVLGVLYNMTGSSPYRIQNPPRNATQTTATGSITFQCGVDADTQFFNTALSGAVTVTLSTTGAWNGCKFRIIRGPSATGAFNMTVAGGQILSAASQQVDYEFIGGAWTQATTYNANVEVVGTPSTVLGGGLAVSSVNFNSGSQHGTCTLNSAAGDQWCIGPGEGSTDFGIFDFTTSKLPISFTSTGITSRTGLQIFNTTTTCTTGASVGATCTTAAINLPVAEPDTSYRLVCTGKGLTNVPVVIATTNSSATQFTITIAALTAAAASFASYDCVAGHN